MAQRKNIFHNFVNNPYVYKIIQKIMSGTSFRRKIIKNHIRKKNLKILDIGCGPAEILDYIQGCEYYGYDIDKRSIEYAKQKYLNKR